MMISSGWDPSVSQGTDNWMLPILAIFIAPMELSAHALLTRTVARVWR
jgi:hypothetical protein